MTDTTPGLRDDTIATALALLNSRWPTTAALDDCNGVGTMTGLAADTRYLIGRLHQGLITLLADDLPPMDSLTSLLSQALKDAIAWRQHDCPHCPQSLCAPCNADWEQADRYHNLALMLGAVGDQPAH